MTRKINITILLLVFIISALFVLYYSRSSSFLFLDGILDAQIYQYMGYAITKGKIPYTDYFDNKGLLLYFYNALGCLIQRRYGIILLQWINLVITSVILYKTCYFVKRRIVRLLLLPVGLLCLAVFYDGGNLTEEWSLPFICYPIYLYFRKYENAVSVFSRKDLLSIGLCIGAVFMIRLNNIAPVLGMLIYCLFIACMKRQWRYIMEAFVLVAIGAAIPVLIGTIFMLSENGMQGVNDMFYGVLWFNIDYAKNYGATESPSLIDKFRFMYKVWVPAFLLSPLIKKKPDVIIPIILAYIVSSMSLGKMFFTHYLQIFIPLIVITLAIVTTSYRNILLKIVAMLFIIGPYVKIVARDFVPIPNSFIHQNNQQFETLISKVPYMERNNIYNYNNPYLLYSFINAGLYQKGRVFILNQIDLSDGLKAERNRIIIQNPKYVILTKYPAHSVTDELCSYSGSQKDKAFIETSYVPLQSVLNGDGTEIILYKKK